jgi:hypothetical protein
MALLAALVLLAIAAPPADAAKRPLRTGVSYLYITDADPVAFENVRKAGGRMVLTPLEWGWVGPRNRPASWQPEDPADPNYDWDAYDRWVVNAVAAGLTPVLQVRGAPTWAQRCGPFGFETPCDLNPDDLAAFATAAARRYSGQFGGLPKVRYWQGLNEPNLSLFFMPQFVDGKAVSADLYRNLINVFYGAVKAVDPSNLVIAAGLGPIAVPKYTIGPMRFTRELLCMRGHNEPRPTASDCGGGVRFDIYDVHPYTTGSPVHEGGINDVQLGDLRKLVSLLRAADQAGRIKGAFKRTPLWVTEVSWDSNPPDPGGLPFRILTRWTSEMLYRAWSAGVSDVFWFSLRDFAPDSELESYESPESGLYYRGATPAQDVPKPNVKAFRFPFVAYPRPAGLVFWGRTPNSRRGKVVVQALKDGRWRRVDTARADGFGIFRGIVKGLRYGRGRRGAVRAHYAKQSTAPFSMRPVPDFRHPPFGAPVG